MNAPPLSVERIDETFRQLFQAELPERSVLLEQSLAAWLASPGDDRFNGLYRAVHNLKGNAATFGFHAIVAICHSLEDLLKSTPEKARDQGFRDRCLGLIDLLADAAGEGDDVLQRIEGRLAALKAGIGTGSRRALLIGDSRATLLLCREVLAAEGFAVVHAGDGYMGLHRALTEPFEIIVTTGQTRLVKGEALVAALRLSDSANRDAVTVVLTSGPGRPRQRKRHIDPDHILARDERLAGQLRLIAAGIKR